MLNLDPLDIGFSIVYLNTHQDNKVAPSSKCKCKAK